MQVNADSPDDYVSKIPVDRQEVIQRLRTVIKKNLSGGFSEEMSYGMIGFVVPHSEYPPGYHCDPSLPLPFMNLASQKNFIALYHSGIYASPELLSWFKQEYPKHCKTKLDMGKSCIRFKKMEDIPYELIGELAGKMSLEEWLKIYEKNIK